MISLSFHIYFSCTLKKIKKMSKPLTKVTWGRKGQGLFKASLADTVATNIQEDKDTFPTPDFSTADMIKFAADLNKKYQTRLNGPVAKTEYETAEHAVENILYTAAHYVNNVSQGNLLIIEKAGFEGTSTVHVPAQVPGQPTLTVKSEAGARLMLESSNVPGTHTNLFIVAWGDKLPKLVVADNHIQISEGANMVIVPDGNLHEMVTGIPPGTQVYCWCLAQNSAGKSPLSNMVEAYIQK